MATLALALCAVKHSARRAACAHLQVLNASCRSCAGRGLAPLDLARTHSELLLSPRQPPSKACGALLGPVSAPRGRASAICRSAGTRFPQSALEACGTLLGEPCSPSPLTGWRFALFGCSCGRSRNRGSHPALSVQGSSPSAHRNERRRWGMRARGCGRWSLDRCSSAVASLRRSRSPGNAPRVAPDFSSVFSPNRPR
jgi:hypothetical protein